jgi:hypothetical protein
MINRRSCVICCNPLTECYTHKNKPITYCPKTEAEPFTSDKFQDLVYGSCGTCGSVQLLTLVDQAELYADPHNITYNTPTWAKHHKSFADFLSNNLPEKSKIIEVGGSSGVLANHLLPTFSDYTIMDFCLVDPPAGIKFIQGNCETFNFPSDAAVIMSHLFEHLYEPRKFIENLANSGVDYAAISIPNIKSLLDADSPAVVHAEHTYYLDKCDAEYMFSCNGYKLIEEFDFGTHSLFMLFKKIENYNAIDIVWDRDRSSKIIESFHRRDRHFGSVNLENNALIVPAGLYGQIIYTHTQHLGGIAGFLDNDPSKQGRRVYGTPCNVFTFDHIRTIDTPIIYIHAGPYTAEIKAQIYSIKPNAIVYDI